MSLYEKSKAKDIIHNKERLSKIVGETLDKMATVVGATLGPGGRAVLLEREGQPPLATKDGVTVAKSLGLDSAEDNIIIEAAKEICINTAKDAGDGTTTAIVLANAITKYGQEFVKSNAKYNPQRIVNELEDVYEDVIVPYIKSQSQDVSDEEKLVNVATISANGDRKIAKVVVEAIMAAGDDGKVLIEEAQGDEMRVETIEGYIITSGLKDIGQLGPMFMNDRGGQQCKMDGGHVFLYNGSINDAKVLGFLETAIQDDGYGNLSYDGTPIMIIAHDYSDTAMDLLAKNTKKGTTLCPIKTPRSGLPNSKTVSLEDIAAYTGATVYDPSNIETITRDGLGQFSSAKSNLYETFIISEVCSDAIEARVAELKAIEAACFSDADRMHVKAHIAKLVGGISTIHVGGVSDLKVRERKARVEDAVEAVRSAIAEGIIPGGCKIQIELSKLLESHPNKKPSWDIMVNALREPFKLLLENCGENYDDIYPQLKDGEVFDANMHEFVDPFKAGIIEPAKVARVAIGNALSVASLLITLGGIVCVPRDSGLENQLAMSKQTFQEMMAAGGANGQM
jgi:chaperonin GroEL